MAKREPTLSVVIPTYNRRESVCEAVRSLCDTTYSGSVEVIVVVDGSTDDTAASLRQLGCCRFPMTVIEQPNGGLACARNRGAAAASASIILFLDDDMTCDRNLLKEHARTHRAGADAVNGQVVVDSASSNSFLADAVHSALQWERPPELTPFDICGGQLSVNRGVFEELGGFDEKFTEMGGYGNEDAEFAARLLKKYDVRYNAAAITHQRYIVEPREYMRRAARLAAADLRLAESHPELRRKLFDQRGASDMRLRLRLASRIPLLPKMLAEVAVFSANAMRKTPHGSHRTLARLFHAAYRISYWSAVRAAGPLDRTTGRTEVAL